MKSHADRGIELSRAAAVVAGALALVIPSSAGAQAAPAGIAKQAQASTGVTEVAKTGFQAVAAPPEDSKDAQSFKVSLGGMSATGNARTVSMTAAADYRLRRGLHQLGALFAANYGASDIKEEAVDGVLPPDTGLETSVKNFQGMVRYDYFFTGPLAGFVSASGRHDPFQKLDLRLNIDPGLAYYFIDEQDLLLWGEAGYDLQHDVRTDDAVVGDVEKTETRHNLRLFAGFDHSFTPSVSLETSAEYLQALQETVNWRLNWGAALTSQLADSFSVAATVTVKYDHNPVDATVKNTDVVSSFNLVYQLK